MSFETLEHCPHPGDAARNFYASLRFGGKVFASVPNGLYERQAADGSPVNQYHVQSFTPQQFQEMFVAAGFSEVRLYGQAPGYGPIAGVARSAEEWLRRRNGRPMTGSVPHKVSARSDPFRRALDALMNADRLCRVVTKPRKLGAQWAEALLIEARK